MAGLVPAIHAFQLTSDNNVSCYGLCLHKDDKRRKPSRKNSRDICRHFTISTPGKNVDGRDKPGHDGGNGSIPIASNNAMQIM